MCVYVLEKARKLILSVSMWAGAVCVKPLYFRTCVLASLSVSVHVCAYMCVHVCVLVTAAWFIPSFSGVAVWGPLCVMPMHRGLYVIEVGLWKPPAIWTPAALYVCLSIRQFLLIAQSPDSVPWLSIEWFLHRLNTLISNRVWDLTNPRPWYWPYCWAGLRTGRICML